MDVLPSVLAKGGAGGVEPTLAVGIVHQGCPAKSFVHPVPDDAEGPLGNGRAIGFRPLWREPAFPEGIDEDEVVLQGEDRSLRAQNGGAWLEIGTIWGGRLFKTACQQGGKEDRYGEESTGHHGLETLLRESCGSAKVKAGKAVAGIRDLP